MHVLFNPALPGSVAVKFTAERNRMKVIRCAACFALGSMAFSVSLLAAPSDAFNAPISKRVYFGDLNVNNKEGATKLFERIKGGARDVCHQFENSRELAQQAKWSACNKNAIAGAVSSLHLPLLTAIYDSHHSSKTAKAASIGSDALANDCVPAPLIAGSILITQR
jgi:UrcA family protein